jgi:hypothetical protein
MTMLTHVDRLLGSVLEADGPQTVPPGLVEAALVEARTTGQRRPLLRPFDPLAWPPLVGPLPRWASRRMATLAVVALLVVVAIAVALLVGSPRPPRVLADGQRAFVWLGDRAYQFIGDGSTEHQVTPGRSLGGRCPTLVTGTTAIARPGFMGWDLVDVSTDAVVAHITFNIAGREVWSPDGRRMVILDEAGRIGVATVGDRLATELVWYEVPNVQAFDWSRDGDRLVFLSRKGSELTLEVIDVTSWTRQPILRSVGQSGAVQASSEGRNVVLAYQLDASSVAIVDAGTGGSTELSGISGPTGLGPDLDGGIAVTADGTSIAIVRSPTEILITDATGGTVGTTRTSQPARDLAWSGVGDRLAFREGDTLVVVDRDGARRRAVNVAPSASFQWDPATTDLIVASAGDDGVAVERYETASLTTIAHLAQPPSAVASSLPSSRGFVDEVATPICLQLDTFRPSPLGDP